jgi:hypothetical protein
MLRCQCSCHIVLSNPTRLHLGLLKQLRLIAIKKLRLSCNQEGVRIGVSLYHHTQLHGNSMRRLTSVSLLTCPLLSTTPPHATNAFIISVSSSNFSARIFWFSMTYKRHQLQGEYLQLFCCLSVILDASNSNAAGANNVAKPHC